MSIENSKKNKEITFYSIYFTTKNFYTKISNIFSFHQLRENVFIGFLGSTCYSCAKI